MVSPDSQATACLPSGRNSTYRPVQISGTGSYLCNRLAGGLSVDVGSGSFSTGSAGIAYRSTFALPGRADLRPTPPRI